MQTSSNSYSEIESQNIGAQFPLCGTHETGTYVCNWSGHLIRLSDGQQSWGSTPFFSIIANEPLYLTKISDDPFVPVSKARQIASNMDVAVNF